MGEAELSEQSVERIAEAVVRKLDEHEQINAIASLVLRMLELKQKAQSGETPAAVAGVASSNQEANNG